MPLGCLLGIAWLLCSALCTGVAAYIPASPTNDSIDSLGGSIWLRWHGLVGFDFKASVSFQLQGNGSTNFSVGALVQYTEDDSSKPPSATPFIAWIPCDHNSTNTTLDNDIFTMARDSGAVAAVLYTTQSQACVINPDYADPDNFDRVLDIYTTVQQNSARIVNSQFGEVDSQDAAYNSSVLNASLALVQPYLTNLCEQPEQRSYLIATLVANGTDPCQNSSSTDSNGSGGQGNGQGNSGPTTSVAMIILYVVVGSVAILFCTIIISGAIRAARHPERYGGRRADNVWGPNADGRGVYFDPQGRAPPQSRAAGLGRAVLDSFPLIKFGQSIPTERTIASKAEVSHVENGLPKGEDIEMKTSAIAATSSGAGSAPKSARETGRNDSGSPSGEPRGIAGPSDQHVNAEASPSVHGEADLVPQSTALKEITGPKPATPTASSETRTSLTNVSDRTRTIENAPNTSLNANLLSNSSADAPGNGTQRAVEASGKEAPIAALDPSQIGHETCPICFVDFEEGDDVRVLPCEGRHKFHQVCIDPWLLELSSSCPICRADFAKLESMAADNANASIAHGASTPGAGPSFSNIDRAPPNPLPPSSMSNTVHSSPRALASTRDNAGVDQRADASAPQPLPTNSSASRFSRYLGFGNGRRSRRAEERAQALERRRDANRRQDAVYRHQQQLVYDEEPEGDMEVTRGETNPSRGSVGV